MQTREESMDASLSGRAPMGVLSPMADVPELTKNATNPRGDGAEDKNARKDRYLS